MRSKNLLIRNQEQTLLPAGDFLAFKKCARVWLEIWDFLTKISGVVRVVLLHQVAELLLPDATYNRGEGDERS